MSPEEIYDKCEGCKRESAMDITLHLEYCSHCKRAYFTEFEQKIHKDLYEKL